jgi:hypothetical protein
MKPGGLACRRMSHVACKWQPFDPLLGWLMAIDVMGEQETTPIGGSHHPSRDPDKRATSKSHTRDARPTAPALSGDRGHALTFHDVSTVFFLLLSLSPLCRRCAASGGCRS